MSKPNWPEPLPEPIVLHACTAEERAILDAARKYVAAERAWQAAELRGDMSRETFDALVEVSNGAYDALDSAVGEIQP